MMRRFLPTISATLFLATVSQADNWPEFRGPTGMGIVRDSPLPIEWSSTRNIAWKQPVPGTGWSSPIVCEGRVYLTTAVPSGDGPNSDQSLRALCLDASTGKLLWDKEVFQQDGKTAPPIQNKNSHASPTPLIEGQRLYVHFGHQGTACLDLNGNILWTNRTLKYEPVHGNGGSPILVDDLLIFSCDGGDIRYIVALDKNTGKVAWKRDRSGDAAKKFSFSTPMLITVNGQKQVISPASDAAYAYDAKDGNEIWKVTYDGYSVIPRPVFGHGLVFIATGYNTPCLLAIRPDGRGDVTTTHVAWTAKKGVPHTPSLLLDGDELYMISDRLGIASCLDARTGRVHWSQRVGGNYSASPLLANGKIYFQSEEGTAIVVKASRQFSELARNSLDERSLASYAAADGAIFLRTERHLYRIQEK